MAETVTIQKTGKWLKLQSVLSSSLLVAAIIWAVGAHFNADAQNVNPSYSGPLATASVAVVWYLVNRVRIWWNHG